MPWQYKVVVVVSCVFILFIIVHVPYVLLSSSTKPQKVVIKPLKIAGMNPHAVDVLDPSLSYDPITGKSWMAYAVKVSSNIPGKGVFLNVRMASTALKGCEGWIQTKGGFEGKTDDLFGVDGQTVFRSGAWRVETPTLVYDPDDPGREWKLYAYKYFWDNEPEHVIQVARRYGMIVYKYATDPAGSWSTEQWLFSPASDHLPPPYGQMVSMHLNDLDTSLKNVAIYSRPSAIVKDGMLVMTLSAFTKGMMPDRIVMIVSGDHGKSWKYAGTPLSRSDLVGIGSYTRLSGASLIEQDGTVYLAAVLGDEKQHGQGTFIFAFDNFKKGILRRDPKTGVPVVLNHVPLYRSMAIPIGGGFSAYTDACPFGLLTTEQIPGTKNFHFLRTNIKPVP